MKSSSPQGSNLQLSSQVTRCILLGYKIFTVYNSKYFSITKCVSNECQAAPQFISCLTRHTPWVCPCLFHEISRHSSLSSIPPLFHSLLLPQADDSEFNVGVSLSLWRPPTHGRNCHVWAGRGVNAAIVGSCHCWGSIMPKSFKGFTNDFIDDAAQSGVDFFIEKGHRMAAPERIQALLWS